MRVPRPSAAGLASAVTAAVVLVAVPAATAQAAGSTDPAAAAGTTAVTGPAAAGSTPLAGSPAATDPAVAGPGDVTSAAPDAPATPAAPDVPDVPAAATTVCGTYGTMNAYIWASAVRVHTGPSESNTAIGECGPSWVHAYCQLQGGEVVYGAYRNNWWIYAETEVGNFVNGYVSDVFVSGGGNDAPVPGIPVCSS